MFRCGLIRGISAALLLGLLASSACSSSSDSEPTSHAGMSGGGGAGISGAHAGGGKAGQSQAGSEHGGEAHAGEAQGGSPEAGTPGQAGANEAGSESAGGPEAGSGGEGGGNPCAACASGLCLPGGECVDCLPSNDHCPDGKYCTSQNTCAPGCKSDSSCASGVCNADHTCQNCISDLECSEQKVCGAQQCAAACSAAQEGGSAGCASGLTCCSLHCVDVTSDNQHCGACGTACGAGKFCGRTGCVSTQVTSLCQIAKVSVILDGQQDDVAGRAIAQTLVSACAPAPSVREVAQSTHDALNPDNGRPVAGGDELLVVAGGFAVQRASDYLMTKTVAPLAHGQNGDKFQIKNASTDQVLASELATAATASHDIFALEFMREPTSGSLILNAYGFTAGGTTAAAQYFAALAANFATATKAWYVGEWTDMNGNMTPDANEIVLLESGD